MSIELRSSAAVGKLCLSAIGLFIFSLLSLFIVPAAVPTSTHAERGVEAAFTLSITPTSDVELPANTGVFVSSDVQTIGVATSNYTGYTLTFNTAGSSTALTHENENIHTDIATITLPSGNTTGIPSSSFPTNISSYGYSTDQTNYLPVPAVNSDGDELGSTVAANTISGNERTPDTYSISFGMLIVDELPAGTYSNSFDITATANDPVYAVNYNANAPAGSVSNMPQVEENNASGVELILSATTPIRPGFVFGGWNTQANGNGVSYPAGGTIYLDPELGVVSNTFVLYAQWNCAAGYICYEGNGDDGDGTMSPQSASANSSVTLLATNYSKPGYGFAGWSEVRLDPDSNSFSTDFATAVTNNDVYGPQETITMPASGSLTLFAVWVPALMNGNTPVYFQDWAGCSSMNDGDIVALTDNRDNSVYAIAKIKKNVGTSNEYSRCWMIENLRFDPARKTLTKTNTNNPTSSFATKALNASSSTFPGCTSTYDVLCYNRFSIGLGNIDHNNQADFSANSQSNSWYGYGAMYNLYSATAGNDGYNRITAEEGDICPFGWHLPTGPYVSGEYNLLLKALGAPLVNGQNYVANMNSSTSPTGAVMSSTLRSFPLNYVYSGYYSGYTEASSRNAMGLYWTTSKYGTSKNYNLSFDNSNVNIIGILGSNYYNYTGAALRCVANYALIKYYANYSPSTNSTIQAISGNSGQKLYNGDTFSRTNYRLVRWNTAANGTGTDYAKGANVSNLNLSEGQTVNLYAVWLPEYSIVYNGNGGTGDMTDYGHDNVAQGDSITLQAPNYSRSGYGFAGWSFDSSAQPGGQSTIYGPNETISAPAANAPGEIKTLYAVWVQAQSGVTMQTFDETSPTYSNMPNGSVIALTDNRDNETYAIAKLADGNWWMIENLRLDLGSVTITANNTNNPTATFASELQNITSTPYAQWCDGDDPTCGTQPVYNIANVDGSLPISPGSYYGEDTNWEYVDASWHSYGVYYNWYAATAGQSASSEFNKLGTTYDGGKSYVSVNAPGDICPYGWQMPMASYRRDTYDLRNYYDGGYYYNGSYDYLYEQLNNEGTHITDYPNNFVLSGENSGYGGDSSRGAAGYAWSSTVDPYDYGDDPLAFYIENSYYDNSYGGMGPYFAGEGLAVRCSVGKDRYDVVYDGNGATSGSMADYYHDYVEIDSSIVLFSPKFVKTGYGFAGWSTNPNAQPGDGISTIYGPNETIEINSTFLGQATTTGSLHKLITLYAVWVQAEANVKMHTFDDTTSPYVSMPTGSVIALTDDRDGKTYTVAKLDDGKWWMTENLRLDLGNATINASNTNNPQNSWETYAMNSSSSASWSSVSFPRTNYYSISPDITYYDYRTMTAGGNGPGGQGDICPYGWHVPTGSSTGDFAVLSVAMGGIAADMEEDAYDMSKTLRSAPYNFVYGGMYAVLGSSLGQLLSSRDSINYATSEYYNIESELDGFYLSRTLSNSRPYILNVSDDHVEPAAYVSPVGVTEDTPYGYLVRCVAN